MKPSNQVVSSSWHIPKLHQSRMYSYIKFTVHLGGKRYGNVDIILLNLEDIWIRGSLKIVLEQDNC